MDNILIGEGMGNIRFGMTRDEVKKIWGQPDEIDTYSSSDMKDDNTEAYHYDEMEVSVSFDQLDGWHLSSIAVSSPEVRLEGLQLIGTSSEELLQKVAKLDLGEYEREDVSSVETPNHELISFYDADLNFWLENDQVTEIQFGPIADDEGYAE
ncbi:hypothetical protein SAMN06265379_10696 [Saccharicrinis carchari]|uniref:Uncharacterized protein n=1 Tax=Saccharicrinis carchari TaxID=1168039 RepID=A0A521DRD9_SACCC|nr:hypothetical protein [Saccharicrinis carchari]SMO74274.1 hypothetical protein SAMN06265379_10696 [Saccharicrinis carchari]